MQADRKQVERLLKTASGQLEGIQRMVAEDQYCLDISHQLLACQAILKKANQLILRSHLEVCVRQALSTGDSQEAQHKIDELLALMDKLAK